ncbi:hypothetical protein [Nocardiopsis ganjiahuensis]|uniref:hypothetical protein n=1 Tax=Nocardiopsis ganjiahuensis TaxID=239984 RepID=UPI000345B48F|nr:hypothetical protein [Nocardiopsis ganjiahuensis]
METGTIVIIVIAVILIAAGAAVAAQLVILPALRTNRLRNRFGPEYDRALEAHSGKADAEHDLAERLRRRGGTELRDLTPQERAAHADAWASIQRDFVDDPVGSVRRARSLTDTIMRTLGYPDGPVAEDGVHDDASFERRAEDLSVDHPAAVARYRDTWAAGHLAEADRTATENLREALLAYRGLVEALLGGLPQDHGRDNGTARAQQAE